MSRNVLLLLVTLSLTAVLAGAPGFTASPPSDLSFPQAGPEFSPTPSAQAPAAASPQALGCVPNALVTLSSQNAQEMRRIIATIEPRGICPVHVFPPNAFIGFVPPDLQQATIAGITGVYTARAAEDALAALGPAARQAAYTWNSTFVNPEPPPARAPAEPTPQPLVGDLLPAPESTRPRQVPPSLAPGYWQTSEFMAGKVAVGVILLESNGALDPSTENWNSARMNYVVSKIQSGLNWWANTNPNGHLSFYYDIHYQVPTEYEPINRPRTDDKLWIAEAFTQLGYSGANWNDQAHAYLNAIRTTYGTDWAVVALVVDSLNDLDGRFTDTYFGYTYGFLIVMTYDNDGWGPARMDSVTAHEFAHDFGAGDEYCQPGYACCWGWGSGGGLLGYLGIPNLGCEAGCDHDGNGVCDGNDVSPNSNCRGCPTCVETTCLMRSGSITSGLDEPSRYQIGMRDSDGDGILDPVDTTPIVTIDREPPDYVGSDTLTYEGVATDDPYDSPTRPDVTINHITSVEAMIDNDNVWRPGSAADGTFDNTTENYSFTTPPLADGEHSLKIRARNRAGNYSTAVTDTITIDTLAPSGSILISDGVTYTRSSSVALTLAATDAATSVEDMRLSNSGSAWSAWESFATSKTWTLAGGDGVKTVYVQYRDNVGNVSASITDTIVLDTVAPTSSASSPATSAELAFDVSWVGSDSASGIAAFDVQYRLGSTGSWTDWLVGTSATSATFGPSSPVPVERGQTYFFRVRAKDGAGNWETYPAGDGDTSTQIEEVQTLLLPLVFR